MTPIVFDYADIGARLAKMEQRDAATGGKVEGPWPTMAECQCYRCQKMRASKSMTEAGRRQMFEGDWDPPAYGAGNTVTINVAPSVSADSVIRSRAALRSALEADSRFLEAARNQIAKSMAVPRKFL